METSSIAPSRPIRFAGFWLRSVATILDWIALQCLTWLVELLVLGALYWTRVLLKAESLDSGFWDTFNSLEAQLLEGAIYLLLSIPYFVWAQVRFGTTLGKWPLGLVVVRAKTFAPITLRQSAVRWACYLLSYLPLGTGYLMAAFHPEKRALHDLIAGTVVIARRPRAPVTTG